MSPRIDCYIPQGTAPLQEEWNEGIRKLTISRKKNLLLQLDSYNQDKVPMSRDGIREYDECR